MRCEEQEAGSADVAQTEQERKQEAQTEQERKPPGSSRKDSWT
jgi:hypothetical protein